MANYNPDQRAPQGPPSVERSIPAELLQLKQLSDHITDVNAYRTSLDEKIKHGEVLNAQEVQWLQDVRNVLPQAIFNLIYGFPKPSPYVSHLESLHRAVIASCSALDTTLQLGKKILDKQQASGIQLQKEQQIKSDKQRKEVEAVLRSGSIEEISVLPGMQRLATWLQQYGSREQHQFHDYNLRDHSQQVLEQARVEVVGRNTDSQVVVMVVAAALHDIGKVGSQEAKRLGIDANGRDVGHTAKSSRITAEILQAVTWLQPEEKRQIQFLVQHHDWMGDLGIYRDSNDSAKQKQVWEGKDYVGRFRDLVQAARSLDDLTLLYRLTLSDIAGIKKNKGALSRDVIQMVKAVYHEAMAAKAEELQKSAQSPEEIENLKIDQQFHIQQKRIIRRESLTDRVGGKEQSVFSYALPSHRCNIGAALGILTSGVIVSTDQKRGVNFKIGGLGADYGCITFIGKGDEARVLDSDVLDPLLGKKWDDREKHPLNIYDMSGVRPSGLRDDQLAPSKASDLFGYARSQLKNKVGELGVVYTGSERHTPELVKLSRDLVGNFHDLATIPPSISGQLNIGVRKYERDYYADRLQNVARKIGTQPEKITGMVPIEAISAIMIPEFLLADKAVYTQITDAAKKHNIEVIVVPTGPTVLEYLGESLAYFLSPADMGDFKNLDALRRYVEQALDTYLKNNAAAQLRGTFEDKVWKFLCDQKIVNPNENRRSAAIRVRDLNTNAKLNRGGNYGGQFINTVGKKAHSEEEKAFFSFVSRREREAKKAAVKKK